MRMLRCRGDSPGHRGIMANAAPAGRHLLAPGGRDRTLKQRQDRPLARIAFKAALTC
jgi:hypothetical protein